MGHGRFSGCLLGLAAGDARGATLGHGLVAGQWTDDTAMALCLAESLLAWDGFDARDPMQRDLRWWQDGHWSSTGAPR